TMRCAPRAPLHLLGTISTMSTDSTLMSVREAARRLGVHDNTVRRYADRGLLRAVRLPSGVRRIRREDVEALQAPSAPRPGAVDREQSKRTIDQLATAQAVGTIESLDDLVAPEVWESDEQLREFLAMTYAERDRDR
ncbi:MAG: helix-turn-helix domain-containing protein, partial [Actinobacteria bacterium]|nr:helix-turn-helix domain-containing protein [Actinomycetota bacterium]